MSGLLNTSKVVRYLTGDPPELAERAVRVIDGQERLQVTDVVIAETAYVLMSVYGIPRSVVVNHLVDFLQKENIVDAWSIAVYNSYLQGARETRQGVSSTPFFLPVPCGVWL